MGSDGKLKLPYEWDAEPDGPGLADDHYGSKPMDPVCEIEAAHALIGALEREGVPWLHVDARRHAAVILDALLASPACRAELLAALTENIASPVCSVSYCAGANGWGGPEYPTCDGCNSDGTISTLVTVAVDAALLVARTPEGDER